jgi:hypothetical protein
MPRTYVLNNMPEETQTQNPVTPSIDECVEKSLTAFPKEWPLVMAVLDPQSRQVHVVVRNLPNYVNKTIFAAAVYDGIMRSL